MLTWPQLKTITGETMNRLVTISLCFISFNLSAMELVELKKNNDGKVTNELLAAVIKVPTLSKLLAEHYVTAPIDASDITFDDEKIEIIEYKSSSMFNAGDTHEISPNYFKCPMSTGELINRNGINNLRVKSYTQHDHEDDIARIKFFFDGPNKQGMYVACTETAKMENVRLAITEQMDKAINRIWGQATWSVALSENNRAAFSSVSTRKRCAFLELFQCKKNSETKKILGISKSKNTIKWDSKKVCTLEFNDFHLFHKMSFLSEDLLLGVDEKGQLYTIEPYFEEENKSAAFHHLTFKTRNDSSYITNYALDSYDKHTTLLVDDKKDIYIGKITANKLKTKKIRSLEDVKKTISNQGNAVKDLIKIRLAGNACYFIFTTENNNKDICLKFNLIAKQPSPKAKVDMIKAAMLKK